MGFIDFELKLPDDTVVTSLSVFPLLSVITESVFSYGDAQISFRVNNTLFHNKILRALNSAGNPLIRFRWGTGDGSIMAWTPWQLHYVLDHQAVFEGVGTTAGHLIKLHTKDMLHSIDRSSRTAPFKGSVSDIVQTIANNNGLNDCVIEPTSGQGVWIQSYEGDFAFVRRRLIRRARSKRGRGNYFLYVRDNVLHFHTLEYQTAVKDMAYYSSPSTFLEAFEMTQAKIPDGSAGARVINYDPFTGEARENNSDPNKAIKLGNSIARLDKISAGQRNIQEHKIHIRDEEAGSEALAQNAYEYARAESYQLKLSGNKLALIRPGELLRLAIDPSAGNVSTWSGLYLTVSAQQTIDKGVISSVYVLQRGEQQVMGSGNSSVGSYGVDSVQDDQSAPGYAISLPDAQSSGVTKGAGQVLSSGVFLTVQDKSSALLPPTPTS